GLAVDVRVAVHRLPTDHPAASTGCRCAKVMTEDVVIGGDNQVLLRRQLAVITDAGLAVGQHTVLAPGTTGAGQSRIHRVGVGTEDRPVLSIDCQVTHGDLYRVADLREGRALGQRTGYRRITGNQTATARHRLGLIDVFGVGIDQQ